jgi:hypothetical protein
MLPPSTSASPTGSAEEPVGRDEPLLVYRPRPGVVLAASALAIVLALLAGAGIAVAIASASSEDEPLATAALLAVLLVVPFAVLLWRQSRVRLEVGATSIRAVNHFSSFRVGWRDIARFEDGDSAIGIVARLRDGSTVRLNAIQQSNLARWLGSPTEAEYAAIELNRWLYRLRWETTSRRGSQPARRPDPERDHDEDERGHRQPVPHEDREVAPS